MKLVVLGLSLSCACENGHATTYRTLLRAFAARGHEVLFLERDDPWRSAHRDLPQPDFCRLAFYGDVGELTGWRGELASAEAVVVGSSTHEGVAVGRWAQLRAGGVTGFYDFDTPVTLARLAAGDHAYVSPQAIPGYDLYLSFTGGPALRILEEHYGARAARALYGSVDAEACRPLAMPVRWDLSYLGDYGPDRQPALERLLIEAARQAPDLRFCVAGAHYPADIDWPANVERLEPLRPGDHPAFYAASRFALNLARAVGWSPNVQLLEAAACGTPVISDRWDGIETLFAPGREILLADGPQAVLSALRGATEAERTALGAAGRQRILAAHTAAHRAAEFEAMLREAAARAPARSPDSDRRLRAAG